MTNPAPTQAPINPERPPQLGGNMPEPPKIHFVTHREDPRLCMAEAGRLVGYHGWTISRLCETGAIKFERDERGLKRVRKSEIVRFFRLTAHARKSNFFWVQESELPDDYQYLDNEYPAVRVIDSIKHFPVPMGSNYEQT